MKNAFGTECTLTLEEKMVKISTSRRRRNAGKSPDSKFVMLRM